ncbi:molybdopterin cofactor-binding domain-containing protein [Parasediminibacterium sp. JCM 36343]|uniref:molybdopterin cofactor-binding domain-containing protein n=1 Tax=Parasediminibacterium sp. JCM 36343 TaxID=3374279 RepID=UPI00397D7007
MVQFILNNQLVTANQADGSTVLDYVRYFKQLKGTKIGCREGDCGACTILVGDFENGNLVYRSMTSCLMPLSNAGGKHIVSVEGINMATLSPVQEAMAATNGTQCGFCTIGFVMSLTGFVLGKETKEYDQAIASIDGNICRCTGYKSIERAAAMLTEKVADKPNEKTVEWLVANGFIPDYFLDIKERLTTLKEKLAATASANPSGEMVVGGGTDLIVQRHTAVKKATIVNVFDNATLKNISFENGQCHVGASVTVTSFAESDIIKGFFPDIAKHTKLISSTPIRNMATLAGNLVNASPIGDMSVYLLALDSSIVLEKDGNTRTISLKDFYKGYKQLDKLPGEKITNIIFTPPSKNSVFNFEKVCKRTHLDIASVNSVCLFEKDSEGIITNIHISAGGVAPYPKYLTKTVQFLKGNKLTADTISEAIDIMNAEIAPISDARGTEQYKRLLLEQLFQAHFRTPISSEKETVKIPDFTLGLNSTNLNYANLDAPMHVTGKSIYTDDIPVMEGTLFVKVFDSPIAHGHIRSIDYSKAEQLEGIVKIFSYKDVTGENQIGGIIPDEPLLADHEVHFRGQPILLIVAENEDAAEEAFHLITIDIDPLPVITDPREAFAQGKLLSPSRKFVKGNVEEAFSKCEYVFEGVAASGGQEHLYLETQAAYAYPTEHDSVKVFSSTQGPTAVQRTIARVLGVGMHKVEVDVARLGGGFGGKEDQASTWGAIVALVTYVLKKPSKCVPHRMEDMRMTGKRNPYNSDYKIGLDKDYKIIAYQATFYQNGGAAADLSPAIMERTLFHATNTYGIEHVFVTAHSCRTNLPPNTAFRGFGGPQGMFLMESAIDRAAKELGVATTFIQRKNLMDNGYELSYGQVIESCEAKNCWDQAATKYGLAKLQKEAADFNANNKLFKKGVSMMPICFGISFTNTMMNQARALVHVYSDGSVGVSTGAIEMGQGVNTKMLQVASACFGISYKRIKLETTNTSRVANTSPTAASAAADLNGKAVEVACNEIMGRLKETVKEIKSLSSEAVVTIKDEQVFIDGEASDLTWQPLVLQAFMKRINLSSKGHYATPMIHFDKTKEKGHPFAYHVYGSALTAVTVDCIRGTYEIDAVHVVHDFGTSINRAIDLGQCEGGLVQGIGWMTMEEVVYNKEGRLLSNALSTYKIPDIYSVPKVLDIDFLHTDGSELAIFKSKAVGEPPLMYGIGAYFAIRNAVLAYNKDAAITYNAPITPEKVLMGLHTSKGESAEVIAVSKRINESPLAV